LARDGFDGAKILEVQFEAKKHLPRPSRCCHSCTKKQSSEENRRLEN
jgi:hypothetical protein